MAGVLGVGIFWTLYGTAALLWGFQFISEKYKNHDWTPDYVRCRGIAWLMIGIPWIILSLLADSWNLSGLAAILLIFLFAAPGCIYSTICERKYKRLLRES